jgi:hypothetical protein
MKIEYRKDQPPTARTWFAKFPIKTTPKVLNQLTEWLLVISEASVQGTDKDRNLWRDATTPDKELWRRSQEHRNQPNTMISVLAGAISKMRGGGDLTEKQLENVKNIAVVMAHYTHQTEWQFQAVDEFTKSGNSVQDLQDRLFEHI